MYKTAQFKQELLPTLSEIERSNFKLLWQSILENSPA